MSKWQKVNDKKQEAKNKGQERSIKGKGQMAGPIDKKHGAVQKEWKEA